LVSRIKKWFRKFFPKKRELNWKEKGEGRGRTVFLGSPSNTHSAKGEPEAFLNIKVTRVNGTIEEYDV